MAKRRPTKKKARRKKATGSTSGKNGSLFDAVDDSLLQAIPLRQAAQERYLNYSLSVITSRALPDVRDGLKPVQRRILYTMGQTGLTASQPNIASVRKSSVM